MLTPEEVRALLLPVNTDYIKRHGIDSYMLTREDYTYLGVRHHGRLMTGPSRKGGRPYTGLQYDWDYDSGQVIRYTEIKDGYYYGDDVEFYDTGALESYERKDDEEHYRYIWYKIGALGAVTEWPRKDQPEFFRERIYDPAGRLLLMRIQCEFTVTYRPNAPDSPYDFTFHENGEFRKITCKAPTARDFYTEIELDPDGIPVRFGVNPRYTEDTLAKRLKDGSPRCEIVHKAKYRLEDGVLYHREQTASGRMYWFRASACIHFRDSVHGDRIIEYQKGKPEGKQCIYYPSGKIQEQYFLSDGKEYCRHISWHPNGVMREATVYSGDAVMLQVTFDDKGNLLSHQLHTEIFNPEH